MTEVVSHILLRVERGLPLSRGILKSSKKLICRWPPCGIILPAVGSQFPQFLGVPAGDEKILRLARSHSVGDLGYDGGGGVTWEWFLGGEDLKCLSREEQRKRITAYGSPREL